MNAVTSLVVGVIVLLLGVLIFLYRSRVAEALQVFYDQSKREYDMRAAKAKDWDDKLFTFIFFRPRTYYTTENVTKMILLMTAPVLMFWGLLMILRGFGLTR